MKRSENMKYEMEKNTSQQTNSYKQEGSDIPRPIKLCKMEQLSDLASLL